ncbi:MAG: prepilin-type N-terminal cleavage/methylation domain-containing protein [Pseudomonadota bacterium]
MTEREQKHQNYAKSGFTLMEVLIAFAILSISLTLLFKSVSDGAWHLKTAEDKTIAIRLAQSTLARVGRDIPLKIGAVEGQAEDGLNWKVIIREYEISTAKKNISGLGAFWVVVAIKGPDQNAFEPLLETLKIGAQK